MGHCYSLLTRTGTICFTGFNQLPILLNFIIFLEIMDATVYTDFDITTHLFKELSNGGFLELKKIQIRNLLQLNCCMNFVVLSLWMPHITKSSHFLREE
jgi:hypothetical protein